MVVISLFLMGFIISNDLKCHAIGNWLSY